MFDQDCLGKLREFISGVIEYYASAGIQRNGPIVLTEQMAHVVLTDYKPDDIRACLIELEKQHEIEIVARDPIQFIPDGK
jgi:hypothetical protein